MVKKRSPLGVAAEVLALIVTAVVSRRKQDAE